MATLTSGLYYCEQNLKYPGINQAWSFRMALTAAGTTQTTPLPGLASNPGQITVINAVTPYNSPQQGRKFIPFALCVRDVSSAVPATPGNLSGAGASAGGTVQIIDQAQSNAVVATLTAPATASPAQALLTTLTTAPVLINPYDQLAVTYTQPTGATATATGFTLDLFGFWQGGI